MQLDVVRHWWPFVAGTVPPSAAFAAAAAAVCLRRPKTFWWDTCRRAPPSCALTRPTWLKRMQGSAGTENQRQVLRRGKRSAFSGCNTDGNLCVEKKWSKMTAKRTISRERALTPAANVAFVRLVL